MPYEVTKWSMRRFRARQWVKHVNYDVWQFTEKVCRKILFVPKNKDWDIWDEKQPDEKYYTINNEKLEASIRDSHIRFHGIPRREHYMDATLRFIFLKWYEPLFDFKRWVRNKFEWYLFFKARDIEWRSHHYINKTGNSHIDGYFEYKVWGIKCGRTFDLCSRESLTHDAMEWDTNTKTSSMPAGAYINLQNYGKWGFPTLVVLKDSFDYADIDSVLNKWYSDQVEWKYRHWTWKGDRPNIVVTDMKFMEDLCQTCHYGSDDPNEHADWCEDNKNEHGTKDISN